MNYSTKKSAHSFHIPVMGTGFSIDTPLKVARYGISSAISLVDDILIEQMRKFHSQKLGLSFVEIPESDKDARANRISAYLDFVDELVRDQVRALQASPFEDGSEISRYFEMLPDSPLRQSYLKMLTESDPVEKTKQQDALRPQAVSGSIDVNIMTKVDRDIYRDGKKLPPESADAMAALRGYAQSKLRSSIVFSAGINRRLYGYLNEFEDFFPDDRGVLKKKITLKVSDFRSATVQGKYLARRGLWVSEYRIESGLNCGGHAFATDGLLMGSILEEFRLRKTEFVDDIHAVYSNALATRERPTVQSPLEVLVTVQGGIGTSDENEFLLNHYGVDGTGWGTPFLLVPEVTNVDDDHLKKLSAASESDVYLSDRSPLGVPFWSLRSSACEETLRKRITAGKPGSPCPKGFLIIDTEFTKVPICYASRVYQKRKLKQFPTNETSSKKSGAARDWVLSKACICHDLAGGATLKLGIDPEAQPAVCCGPNIVNFSKISTLEEMVGHIYGRISILADSDRPNMFIREVMLYVDFLRQEIRKESEGMLDRTAKYFQNFKQNLTSGIEHYRSLAENFSMEQREHFVQELDNLLKELETILPGPAATISLKATT